MVRPGSFFSRSASFAVVGTGFLAPRQLDLDGSGGRSPFGAVGVAGLLRHQFGGNAEPHAGAGIGDDLPADIVLPPLRGVGEDAAFLRIEHAGLLAAAGFLEFLDRGDHALADVAGDRAVILADPGEVRLQRQAFGLRHRVGGLLRLLQRGADRDRRDRFRLGPRRGRRRQLRLRGCPQNRKNGGGDHQCCRKHRSHDKSQGKFGGNVAGSGENIGAIIDVRPIKHICLVGNNRGHGSGSAKRRPGDG